MYGHRLWRATLAVFDSLEKATRTIITRGKKKGRGLEEEEEDRIDSTDYTLVIKAAKAETRTRKKERKAGD